MVDIRYRNKCYHSKSPLQVTFLELMAQGGLGTGKIQGEVVRGNYFGDLQLGGGGGVGGAFL